MNPYEKGYLEYQKEMQERGRRYYRRQRMWEVVEGVVITLLFIGMVWWAIV